MRILAIETSCDETGLALIEAPSKKQDTRYNNQIKVIANLVRSQIELHRPYGGVFPNLAKREHIKVLPELLKQLQETDNFQLSTVNLIAVTQGPGLSPCLWAGINFAKELAEKLNVPLVGVNHLKGHIFTVFPHLLYRHPVFSRPDQVGTPQHRVSARVEKGGGVFPEYPILALIVSGGHTELVYSKQLGQYKIIGRTRDDAAGEAFDKVARLLGLGYPGGPEISRLAERGSAARFNLPRPMIDSPDFDFSFAGLKTAVVYLLRGFASTKRGETSREPLELNDQNKADLAASFQQAAVDVLVQKTLRAAKNLKPKTIILGGGVAANKLLRSELAKEVKKSIPDSLLLIPDSSLTGDNALMIALAAWYERDFLKPEENLEALPNLRIDEK